MYDFPDGERESFFWRFAHFPYWKGIAAFALCCLCFAPLLFAGFGLTLYVDSEGPAGFSLVDGVSYDGMDSLDVISAGYAEDCVTVMNVERSYDVSLSVRGEERSVRTNSETTLSELLRAEGVTLGSGDVASLPLAQPVPQGVFVSIDHIETRIRTSEELVASTMVERRTPAIKDDAVKVIREGSDGSVLRTYEDVFVNGEYSHTQTVGEEILTEVSDGLTLIGDSSAVVSPLEWDIEIIDGVPAKYESLMVANCTAYSAPEGSFGASGMCAEPGFVAVDTDVIPYGTLMYITNKSGSFVYGFAIAGDTGLAMMAGTTDIDLFFDNNTECRAFGRRDLNVYIIGQLTQSELLQYRRNAMFDTRIPKG